MGISKMITCVSCQKRKDKKGGRFELAKQATIFVCADCWEQINDR